jgi:solute carrier family 10 (sodium/bile acid cotransporter), member 7
MRLPSLSAVRLDPFLVMIMAAVVFATLLPVRGAAVRPVEIGTDIAIAILFFLHGAKLSREAILAGLGAWRIHIAVLCATFVLFPLIGLGTRWLADQWLNPAIGAGILLLCLMPSTVQSSIAFTAVARGNVPAAVCSAAASNILGVVVTPVLVALLFAHTTGGISWGAATKIASQLLLPFILGHLCRPLMLPVLDRWKSLLTRFDRGVIVLVVYVAFSAAVMEGLWTRYSIGDLGWTFVLDGAILAAVLLITTVAARVLKFNKPDEIVIVFCGSKKSLASGVPIAGALFPSAAVGPMILPLMLFHQMQLMACAMLAQRYAKRAGA